MHTPTSSGHGADTPEDFAQHELAASAFDRYQEMQTDRSQYIYRGRLVGEVTIPYLIPFHEGTATASEQYMTPKSSVGARGVNNLANKLVMALMPPGQPFFKLAMSPFDTEGMDGDERVKIEAGLSAIEQVTRNEMEAKGLRSPMVDAMRSLIITGNALLHVDREGHSRFYRLNQFVVQRDAEGTLLEIILRQTVAARTLPKELQRIAFANGVGSSMPTGQSTPNEDSVDIYTRTVRDGNRWQTWQEFENIKLPNTAYSTAIDEPAWLALTWTLLAGENYGRGPGEEYQGDLDSNESLQDSLITGAAASARVITLVNEGGMTDIQDVAEADNGAVIEGREDDIGTIKVDKAADLSVAKGVQENIQSGLAQIFLLTSDNVRDAERVTAEEIRLLAQELETALGGVFSRFAVELQLPLARRFMSYLTRLKRLPALPKGVVSPEVTTGLPALGRFASLQRLDLLLQGIAETFGPAAVEKKVKMDTYIGLRAAELGVDITGLFNSDEELAEAAKVEHQRAMEQAAAAPMVGALAQQQQGASTQPAQ